MFNRSRRRPYLREYKESEIGGYFDLDQEVKLSISLKPAGRGTTIVTGSVKDQNGKLIFGENIFVKVSDEAADDFVEELYAKVLPNMLSMLCRGTFVDGVREIADRYR